MKRIKRLFEQWARALHMRPEELHQYNALLFNLI